MQWTHLFQTCFWCESYDFWKCIFNKNYSFLCYLNMDTLYKQLDQYFVCVCVCVCVCIQHTIVNWLWKPWFLAMNGRIYTNMWFKLFCESYLHSNLFWLHFTFIGFRGFLATWSFEMKWGCMKGKFNVRCWMMGILFLHCCWFWRAYELIFWNVWKSVEDVYAYLNGELNGKGWY
jgi:hypothetical protein